MNSKDMSAATEELNLLARSGVANEDYGSTDVQLDTRNKKNTWIEDNIEAYDYDQVDGAPDKGYILVPTKSYGSIHFKDEGKNAQFICLAHDTPTDKIYALLVDHWKIKLPQLALSMHQKTFLNTSKVNLPLFKTHGLWIIGDADSNISNESKKQKATTVGIASIDQVKDWDRLSQCRNAELKLSSNETNLNPFYDYFLIIDNGSSEKSHVVQEQFRSHLETFLIKKEWPVVSTYGEGAQEPETTTFGGIIPAIILPCSKPIIYQILPIALEHFTSTSTDIDKLADPNSFEYLSLNTLLQDRLDTLSSSEKESIDTTELLTSVVSILKNNNKIYHVKNYDTFPDVILACILKQASNQYLTMQYAILWDRFNFAKENLAPDWNNKTWGDTSKNSHELFLLALTNGRVKFIDNFFPQPFINNILKVKDFENLYGFGYDNMKTKQLFSEWLETEDQPIRLEHIRKCINYFCEGLQKDNDGITGFIENNPTDSVTEVFLWAILFGYHNLALWLWNRCDGGCERLLLACEMNTKLSEQAEAEENVTSTKLPKQFAQRSGEFAALAQRFLDEAYENDEELSIDLLCRESSVFQQTSCLDMSYSVFCSYFISHQTVQNFLNQIWNGNVSVYTNNKQQSDANGEISFKTSCCTKYSSSCYQFLQAPATKFYTNLISHVVFLVILSIVAIEQIDGDFNVREWITIAYFASFITYSIRKGVQMKLDFKKTIQQYYSDIWHVLDIFTYLFYFTSLGLRIASSVHSHIFLSFTAYLAILRLLKQFYKSRVLGPYVFMIGTMFKEMMKFLLVLLIFLIAHGVCITSVLFPQKPNRWTLVDVIFYPFLNALGDINYDRNQPIANMTSLFSPKTEKTQVYSEFIAWLLLAFYLLIANVLLLNLLIAIFGSIYEDVKDGARDIWSFQKYQIVDEYLKRSAWFHPFSAFADILMFLKEVSKRMGCCGKSENKPLKISGLRSNISAKKIEELKKFEKKVYQRMKQNRVPVDSPQVILTQKVQQLTTSFADNENALQNRLNNIEKLLKQISSNISSNQNE